MTKPPCAAGDVPCSPEVETSLELQVPPTLLPRFFRILQQGFTLRTTVGRSVAAILFQELGLSGEFLDAKVQTLFLNGKTIDDPHSAVVSDGAVIALSSAMPGLVGATLRRGSTYAAMRSQITHNGSAVPLAESDGTVIVKLYNLLLDEVGAPLLQRGVSIAGQALADFLGEQDGKFWNEVESALLDGEIVEPGSIPSLVRGGAIRFDCRVKLIVVSHA